MLDLLKNRRSIRVYQDKKVEKEKIDEILKGALMSPSSKGRNAWEFIVLDDKEKLEKLSRCRDHGSKFLSNAPAAILVASDGEVFDVWIEDASISAIIIQLMAHSKGLGSCWIQVRERHYNEEKTSEEYIKEVLGMPESARVECMIAIGYPAEDKEPHNEDALLYNKIHYNEF